RWSTLFFLNTHGKTLAVSLALDLRRQVTTQIRTPIRRVMLLIALVVPKDINAIEIRFIESMRLIRTALLEYQPASRFYFAPAAPVPRISLLGRPTWTLQGHELATGAIENNVPRHRQFHLLAIDPTRRRRRGSRRQSHLVPELICLLWFLIVVLLPCFCGT